MIKITFRLSPKNIMRTFFFLFLSLTICLAGCAPVSTPVPAVLKPSPTSSPTLPVPTSTATATAPPIIPTLARAEVCSPLAGFMVNQLAGLIVNPYHPPKLGSDDPHQGVDLAILSGPGGIAMSGTVVQAVLAGKVVGKTIDRFPYGNSLLIETPLNEPLNGWDIELVLPTPLPERLPAGALTCPEINQSPARPGESRSLYILYAHMQAPATWEPGDTILCGQEIGVIGDSGNALNPHLHVETRIGPDGQSFGSMAHYDPSAEPDEMGVYCTWRVSGVYQTINPVCLWGDCP